MAADASQQKESSSRGVPLRWVFVMLAGLLVVMAAVVAAVLLVDRNRDEDARPAAEAATGTTAVASPYDLVELPAETDLDKIEKAAFISLYLPNESGAWTSYGISSSVPAAQALTRAVLAADEVDTDTAAAELGARAAGATITFVLPSRETLTFALYLDEGLIARGAQVWRPDGDVQALTAAAIAGPSG